MEPKLWIYDPEDPELGKGQKEITVAESTLFQVAIGAWYVTNALTYKFAIYMGLSPDEEQALEGDNAQLPDTPPLPGGHAAFADEAEIVGSGASQVAVVTVDVLNFPAGVYFFILQSNMEETSPSDFVKVTVGGLPSSLLDGIRTDLDSDGESFAAYLFNDTAFERIATPSTSSSPDADLPIVPLSSVGAIAVRLTDFGLINNSVRVDYYDDEDLEDGQLPSSPSEVGLLKVKVDKAHEFGGVMAVPGQGCQEGTPVDLFAHPSNIAVSVFRFPGHYKGYGSSGYYRFGLWASVLGPDVCFLNFWPHFHTMLVRREDTIVDEPFPDFAAHNEEKFPGEDWRNDYPVDTFPARLVRIGNAPLSGIKPLAERLPECFSSAIKGYFRLEVVEELTLPYVRDPGNPDAAKMNAFLDTVIGWYLGLTKTDGLPHLHPELSDDEMHLADLYLAVLLYFKYNLPSYAQMSDKVQELCAPNPNVKNIYILDAHSGGGHAWDASGCRANTFGLDYLDVLVDASVAQHTFHFDKTKCPPGVADVPGFADYIQQKAQVDSVVQTLLHEFGHFLWYGRLGLWPSHNYAMSRPFAGGPAVVKDRGRCYFMRFDVLSGCDGGVSVDSRTYPLLEAILRYYAQPEAWVEFVLPSDADKDNEVTTSPIFPGFPAPVSFELCGFAGSGLKMLWFYCEQGPEGYDWIGKAQVVDLEGDAPLTMKYKFDLMLDQIGDYVFRCRARDTLYPIVWQPHQSELGTFVVHVKEVPYPWPEGWNYFRKYP